MRSQWTNGSFIAGKRINNLVYELKFININLN